MEEMMIIPGLSAWKALRRCISDNISIGYNYWSPEVPLYIQIMDSEGWRLTLTDGKVFECTACSLDGQYAMWVNKSTGDYIKFLDDKIRFYSAKGEK